jgi:hypothetical protein
MSAEEDRIPLSTVRSQPSAPVGAVFLSYTSEDADAAERMATALRSAGIQVWLDKSALRGGVLGTVRYASRFTIVGFSSR